MGASVRKTSNNDLHTGANGVPKFLTEKKILFIPFFIAIFYTFISTVLAQTSYNAELINRIDTFNWDPESPDPMGITYVPSLNSLLIVDSEVEESPQCHYNNANYWKTSLSGNIARTANTLSFSHEPTEIAYDKTRNRYYVSDDDAKKIFTVNIGSDNLFGTSDDQVTSFSTNKNAPVINDPEGVAYDEFHDYLLIVDGSTNGTSSVYVFSPGTNGVFDGAPSIGDDNLVLSFGTSSAGVSDPEGVTFNYDTGTIYVTGQSKWVLEYSISGNLLAIYDTSALNIHSQSGIAYGPSSTGGGKSLYITDRGVDNDSSSCENDGKIFEIKIPGSSNVTPTLGSVFGDISGDGKVDIADYNLLSENFGTNDRRADLNLDGIVNVLDMTLLSNNFGSGN